MACIWMLAVMDPDDGSRKFIASVLKYYFERGYITERQMEATRDIASKLIRRRLEGSLQCQGSPPSEPQTFEFGTVIELSTNRDSGNCEVLE